jgi:hypothetical protein
MNVNGAIQQPVETDSHQVAFGSRVMISEDAVFDTTVNDS